MMHKSESIDPIIEVDDLVVKYGDHVILNNISTSIASSEIRVILGASGCGKTTLLKAMIGLLQPAKGTVKLFGKEIKDPDSPETMAILKRVGVLFQNGALLGSLTVGDNIALPLRMHTKLQSGLVREIVQLKLTQVDLHDVTGLYPAELSGGMRKRAALARALVLDPPLVFCDEPSAGLDPVTSAGLDNLLLRLRQELGITIVVVTHELSSIRSIADSVVFLSRGEVYFQGSLSSALGETSGPLNDFFNRRETHSGAAPRGQAKFEVERTV
jgi:phospholipid/cholesterol/gamma-HCH transport system ATP-binding protein